MPPESKVETATNSSNVKSSLASDLPQVKNFINGSFVAPSSGRYMSVLSPVTSAIIGEVAQSSSSDVDDAVQAAKAAFPHWSSELTSKSRAALMLRFHALVKEHADELADLIVLENGKNKTEALADVAKGNETVEYACSLPCHDLPGRKLRVSSQVTCEERRDALGVVASVVPFNFPFMVPMWTVPIALVCGNTVVLKPSEKVPLTMAKTAELLQQCGLPHGVFNMVQGPGAETVNALVDHPDVKAVTFVGSSPVASIVSSRCRNIHKRCTALGGAKNHLIALPDCDADSASSDIVVSYAGCAGQRCMAASVLLLVNNTEHEKRTNQRLLQQIIEKASNIKPGTDPGQMGPVIDDASRRKILSFIQHAQEEEGAEVLLDGRTGWADSIPDNSDNWIGPTILRHRSPEDRAMTQEVFGPVLSVYDVSSWAEAVRIENANPFGNAAAVYTSNGGHAAWFCGRFRASMLGVNVGIPVPREPFSFGGLYGTSSKYGDMDITGDGAVEFFTNRIKITTKWPRPAAALVGAVADVTGVVTDHANFAGRM